MLRIDKQTLRQIDLDNPAASHHRDPVADMAHDGEIMGDEQVCEAMLFLQVDKQVDDLRAQSP